MCNSDGCNALLCEGRGLQHPEQRLPAQHSVKEFSQNITVYSPTKMCLLVSMVE